MAVVTTVTACMMYLQCLKDARDAVIDLPDEALLCIIALICCRNFSWPVIIAVHIQIPIQYNYIHCHTHILLLPT